MTDVGGQTAEGWGKVADAFLSNFEEHREIGAACAVYSDGELVVDLWGGAADSRSGRPWARDTVALVFSTTKGATAICAHMLVERGALDLDAPVTRYWPEFGAEGKEEIRVRWLLSHRAGLPVIDTSLTPEEAYAWEPVIRALEAQKPLWTPGTHYAYHTKTYGFLVGEVVRCVAGKTLGAFFADEIAHPLALSSWIGLPEDVEHRVAHLVDAPTPSDPVAALERLGLDPDAAREAAATLRAMGEPDSVSSRAATLGGAFPHVVRADGVYNGRVLRAAELPASNMVTDARSLARMYAATVTEVDGVRLLEPKTVAAMSIVQTSDATPYGVVWPRGLEDFETPFSLGFMCPSRFMPLLGRRSFGHSGAGGSLGFADPEMGIGFGYVMNRLSSDMEDPRVPRLVAAVSECIV